MIKAQDLTKFYGDFLAVDSLNFEIKEGEIFGFLGPNGAGKTTTIRMLAAIFPPSQGLATVAGHDILSEDMQVRSKVGILSENPSIYERLSARDNLEFFAKLYDVPKADISDRINHLATIFDLHSRLDERAGTFSKGMKQKLAIARALMHDPPVLFLDEPTSALSPEASKVIRDLLIELAKDRSRTICICTHNLFDAERVCDRVAIIKKGKILTIGTPSEISNKFSGSPTIRLKLKELSNQLLSEIKDISEIKTLESNQISNSLLIKMSNHEKDTPEIIRKIANLKGNILEVEPIFASLEEAYLSLINEEHG